MGRSVIAAEKGSKVGKIEIFFSFTTLIGLQGQKSELKIIENFRFIHMRNVNELFHGF